MKRALIPAPSAGVVLLMLCPPAMLTAAPPSPRTPPSATSAHEYVDLPDLGDVWSPEYLRNYYAYVVGPEIFDPATRDQFCEAGFFGGNTLRLWNEATDLKKRFLAASALSRGHRVLLVGKFAQETGLVGTIRQLIGPTGALTAIDTTQPFLDGVRSPRAVLQWNFSFRHLPPGAFDRVILFSTVSQMANMAESAEQLTALLKTGGRLTVAEDPVGGREFLAAIHMDTHMEAHTFRMMNGMGITERDLPIVGIPEMARAFARLTHTGSAAWLGLYTFYGQKEGAFEPYTLPPPVPGAPLADFLTAKPFRNPFGWMTARELAVWPLVADPRVRASCAYSLFLGGGLHLIADLNEREGGTDSLMLDNLGLKKGDKVLIISELLDEMGWYSKLERRTQFKMADADAYVYDIAQRVRSARTRSRLADEQPQDQGARSVFYYAMPDAYPDEYFDAIWMPQGCGHNVNWDDFLQRALRVLKTGGRLVMQEHDIQGADFWKAGETVSGLFRSIGEKEYLRNGALPIDENTALSKDTDFVSKPLKAQWEAAVGETLEYRCVFERGCTTFWGTKIPYPMADWWHGYPYLQRYVPKAKIPGR
jgi:SAM-dependent methyltransferase